MGLFFSRFLHKIGSTVTALRLKNLIHCCYLRDFAMITFRECCVSFRIGETVFRFLLPIRRDIFYLLFEACNCSKQYIKIQLVLLCETQ